MHISVITHQGVGDHQEGKSKEGESLCDKHDIDGLVAAGSRRFRVLAVNTEDTTTDLLYLNRGSPSTVDIAYKLKIFLSNPSRSHRQINEKSFRR